MSENEFSVYQFFPGGSYERAASFVTAETAVKTAKRLTETVGARLGVVERVIITDGGDDTVFEWKPGEGVTYPNRSEDAA
jgi:hypothetical protein